MLIKEIRIKNFRSYYGDKNEFKFSDGLTLILGDNGDGKTTLFEAFQWLFNTTIDKGSADHISEMRKSKLEIGEQDEVSVCMSFEHNGEKSVEKSFTFERTGDKTFKLGALIFKGYETLGVERVPVNGKILIDRCYDAFIQRFSMFKGESELNVFNDRTALKQLVDKFSDIRKFDELVENANSFRDKSNAAYLKGMRDDDKVSKEARALEIKMNQLAADISQIKFEIKEKRSSIEIYSTQLEKLESNQEISERYKDITERVKTLTEKKIKLQANISRVDYNHSLLDALWVLCPYPTILSEFKQKCSALSREKRRQEKEFDRKQAEEIGKLNAVQEIKNTLINGSTELPWYLPNQETMEEMINDHVCKVCGRVADEGSDAYNFMINKLEMYKKHIELKFIKKQESKKIEEKSLFKNDYIEELHNLSMSLSGSNESNIARISKDIEDRLELVERFTRELKNVEDKIQDATDEKARLLIQAGNIPESVLEKDFHDIKGLFSQKGRAEIRLTELENDLKILRSQMNDCQLKMNELDPKSSQVKVYKEVCRTLEEIAKAFGVAQKENLRHFLAELQDKANEYLQQLSVNDFHGVLRLVQTADDSTEIKLFSSNGSEIKKRSTSQETVMYISILFAISDFTSEKRDEDYPLFFDAATSSFGDLKEHDFYNVINRIKKQCIIITKDFVTGDKVEMVGVEKLNCPVYRIKKADGLNKSNLATIRTTVEKIKD